VVTKGRVYIHKNQKLGLEITPRTRRFVQVSRDGNRVHQRGWRALRRELVVHSTKRRRGLDQRHPRGAQARTTVKKREGGSWEPPSQCQGAMPLGPGGTGSSSPSLKLSGQDATGPFFTLIPGEGSDCPAGTVGAAPSSTPGFEEVPVV
jgi:hypothetical protein